MLLIKHIGKKSHLFYTFELLDAPSHVIKKDKKIFMSYSKKETLSALNAILHPVLKIINISIISNSI